MRRVLAIIVLTFPAEKGLPPGWGNDGRIGHNIKFLGVMELIGKFGHGYILYCQKNVRRSFISDHG